MVLQFISKQINKLILNGRSDEITMKTGDRLVRVGACVDVSQGGTMMDVPMYHCKNKSRIEGIIYLLCEE